MTAAVFRRAQVGDLGAIITLLANDRLGMLREDPDRPDRYRQAFDRIAADPAQILVVAEQDGAIIGTLQLTFIPGLSRGGALRGQIEAVRVARTHRGSGIGRAMMDWAIARCRAQGCATVQLTTDRSRTDAHRFYGALGFHPTHLGYKLSLD